MAFPASTSTIRHHVSQGHDPPHASGLNSKFTARQSIGSRNDSISSRKHAFK